VRLNDHSINKAACYGSKIVCIVLAILWVAFSHEPAFAHKVNIFAWIDGDTIHTRSKFSGGKRVKNSLVVVFDSEGNSLLKGKTDENGMFSFKIPQKTELKVVLKASMGHMAEWNIPVEEITGSGSGNNAQEIVEKASNKTNIGAGSERIITGENVLKNKPFGLGREEVEEIIDASLDKKLAPIYDIIAKTYDRGPGLTEIIGGIGYIIGLVGVALYFSNRRRKE
jgi:nickel transport protein